MPIYKCEFEVEVNGKLMRCQNSPCGGFCRTKCLCLTHYSFLKRDNLKRANKERDIPLSFETIIRVSPLVKRLCREEVKKPISFNINIDPYFFSEDEIKVVIDGEKDIGI